MNPMALNPVQESTFGNLKNPDGAFQSLVLNSTNSTNQFAPLPWSTPDRLTISFAPDGTRISSYQSELFQSFQSLLTADQLKSEVLKAFQAWSQHSAINVGYTNDSGTPFGVSGLSQGDSRVGDIRVGAIPMAQDVFAVAIKNDSLVAGTWSGDMIFNSNKTFASVTEFYSVALHEAGHVLGLDHSKNRLSVMYPAALNSQIHTSDIASIRGLYGFRRLDNADIGTDNNDTIENATRIKNSGSLKGSIPLIVYGDLPSNADVDYFELPSLSGYTGPIKFELVSSGISLLRPKLTLFDEGGQFISSISSDSIQGDRIQVTVPQAIAGEHYFVKVEAADTSMYSFGSYALKATFESNLNVSPALTERVLIGKYWQLEQEDVQEIFLNPQSFYFNQELLLNDTIGTATRLNTSFPYFAEQHYQAIGSFSYANDNDFYRFKTPSQFVAGNTLTLNLNTMESSRIVPRVQVMTANGTIFPTNILANGNGQLTLQVTNLQPNQTYFLRATADFPSDQYALGNYQFWVRFDRAWQVLPMLARGTLNSSTLDQRQKKHSLYVAETNMLHLSLTADSSSSPQMTQVWVTIYDKSGRPVFRTLTTPGETRTAKSIVLRPGSYSVFVSLAVAKGEFNSTSSYTLRGVGITDPVGPEIVDPRKKPFRKVAPGDPNYVYPGGVVSPDTFVVVTNNQTITPPSLMKRPPFVNPNAWYWYESWLTSEVPQLS